MKKDSYKCAYLLFFVILISSTFTAFAQIPVISSFSPISAKPGDVVTLMGTNFNTTPANNIIFFGATRAIVTTATTNSLTVTVPFGATYAPITLLNMVTKLAASSVRNFTPIYSPAKTAIRASDFQTKQDFTSGSTPYSVTLGDLDGDGKPDLVVANYGSATVSVYRNISTSGSIGAGSFAAKVDFTTGTQPFSVAIGDLDGDGKPDLAVANVNSNTVSLLRNTATSGSIGSGSFAAKVDFTTGTSPRSVAIGDLDGDGKPDLATANYNSATVSVFRNTSSSGSIGISSLATKVDFTTDSFPFSVVLGDLDGDGKPELATANYVSSTVSVIRNISSSGSIHNGSFAPKVDFLTGLNPVSLAMGDLDGDSKSDLVVANYGSATVSIIRNTAVSGSIVPSSFAAKVDFTTGINPYSVAIGDLDGDSKLDIALANRGSNTVSAIRNTSTSGSFVPSSFAAKVDFATGSAPYSVVLGDLDGDGKPDLAASNANSNTVSVLRNADFNADLLALTLNEGTLSTVFTATTTTYTASVANATTNITVTPTVANANANVKVNGIGVVSDNASGFIALNEGSNTITLMVTAQNATTKTYTITVFRSILPTFNAIAPICRGATLAALPTASNNGIVGTWSPTLDNTQTTIYTFTPNEGQNASSTTLTIMVNANPTATASSSTPVICAGNTISLTGGGMGTYAWSGPNSYISSLQSPSISSATTAAKGIYQLIITNANNCTATSTTSVTVNANPTATASSSTPVICSGNTITLTGGGVGTYAWVGPNSFSSTMQSPTISSATVLATGVYTLTVTNANNCTSTATTSVMVNANPTATASSSTPVICAGNTISLTGGGIGTYAWSGPNSFFSTLQSTTISSATVLATGVYTLTVTNANSCGSTDTTSVMTNANPTATASSSMPVICAGNTITLTGEGMGTYAWSGPNSFRSSLQSPSIPSATTAATGLYQLIITNANNCTATATTSVTVKANPTATASSSTPVICAGNTIFLTGGGVGTYAWSGPNSISSTDQNPSIANVTTLASGVYTITVTNTNSCTSTATTSVTVNANPVATASSNSPTCAGNTVSLTGVGGGTYAWSGPNSFSSTAQNPSITLATTLFSGVYTIAVKNTNSCTSTATTSVTVNPVVNPPIPQADTQIIFGGSVTLTVSGCSGVNDVLKWYKSSNNALAVMPVSPTVRTNYYAKCETILNGITCISGSSIDVTVTVLSPTPPVATRATNCLGTPIILNATGCSGSVGTFVLKWYLNAKDALVVMPVSPTTTTDYYARCEQTFNSVTAVSSKSNVVTLTILNPPTSVSTGGTIYNSQSITLTATGCTGTLGTFNSRWYQTLDNTLVTMPVSPTVTTQYYAKCEQTANSVTCLSPKNNDVTVTVVNRIFVDITKITALIQNGNSWATAYGNLQTGLAAAAAGVEVWVADGTYKPTDTITRTIYFNIPNNVKVYGGFAGTEENLIDRNFRTNVTILSGDIGVVNQASDNTYHVLVFDGSSITTVLDGFTITGGYANFDPKRVNAPTAPSTTATIETGGGIVVQNAGSPIIANCNIVNNAAVTGGGIFTADASLPKIMGCKIQGNQAAFGAGIYFQDGGNGSLNNTLISGNRGIGAVYNNISNPTITNCTIAGNGGYNGGIFNSASQPVVKNSIIWGNSTPFNDTQSIITYSTIQGGYPGVGNLSMDPKFVILTPEGLSPILLGDYHVQASSLTLDRGDNGAISLTEKDLNGNLRRFAGGRVDMGVYEFQGTATATLIISVQTGNWEINSTWDIGRVPQLGDYIIINNNHIVTLNGTGIAKNLEYRGTGQLKFNTATSKLEIGF